jgi:ribosomal protein L40E
MEVCRLCGQKKIYYKDITKSEHHVLLIKKLFKITIEENDTNKSVCEECYKSSVSFAIKRKQAQKNGKNFGRKYNNAGESDSIQNKGT